MIEVKGAKDFHRLATRIGKLDKEVQKELKARLKKAAKPVVVEVKAEALGLPSGQGKSSIRVKSGQRIGLRAAIAKSVVAEVKTTRAGAGAHIRVKKKKFLAVSGRNNANLPWYVQGRPKRGWKHPVFGGNMDHPADWPIQKPSPYLDETVKKHKGDFAKEVNEAFTDALTKVGIVFK
jgi:hypothetical protein